jgi:hypothetical protein
MPAPAPVTRAKRPPDVRRPLSDMIHPSEGEGGCSSRDRHLPDASVAAHARDGARQAPGAGRTVAGAATGRTCRDVGDAGRAACRSGGPRRLRAGVRRGGRAAPCHRIRDARTRRREGPCRWSSRKKVNRAARAGARVLNGTHIPTELRECLCHPGSAIFLRGDSVSERPAATSAAGGAVRRRAPGGAGSSCP